MREMIPTRTKARILSIKKKNPIRMDVFARNESLFIEVLMVVRWGIVRRCEIRKSFRQLIWFMDQGWQTLRADIEFSPLKFQ